ncbi:MAG: hypothetical protein NVSMB22_23060 [Chloroflexota bacterium]
MLEPFADELALGAAAGNAEADALSSSGFTVDVKRNGDVTIPVMQSMNAYSFVYIETHSGILPDGNAIVVTGDTNFQPYTALAPVANGGDGSLMQATVAGDPTHRLYIAITATFVNRHVAQFPGNSVVFLNGCSLLRAPLFWQALENKAVGAMISWDQEAAVNVAEPAAAVVVNRLTAGGSVADSIKGAYNAGLGDAPAIPPAHLGFLGNGSNTLSAAAAHATATATQTVAAQPQVTQTAPAQPHATPTELAFKLGFLRVRFEKNLSRGSAENRRLTTVRRHTLVRLSAYYSGIGVPNGCRYANKLTLSIGSRTIRKQTVRGACRTGTWHDSILGVTLSKAGRYTLSARLNLNSGAVYSAKTTARAR